MADTDDRYVREPECKRFSGLSRVTRWRLERSGRFPRRRQLSDNAIGWLMSELTQWKASPSTYRNQEVTDAKAA
jgi:predicted DNA-binding transcriptional regulator AlpA